jgi:serine/threonine protein kinase
MGHASLQRRFGVGDAPPVPRTTAGVTTILMFAARLPRPRQAVEYLHAHSIMHRDIKPANFLLTASLRVKLGDFGVARMNQMSDGGGSAHGAAFESGGDGSSGAPTAPAASAASPTARASISAATMDQTSNVGTVRYAAPEVGVVAQRARSISVRTRGDDRLVTTRDERQSAQAAQGRRLWVPRQLLDYKATRTASVAAPFPPNDVPNFPQRTSHPPRTTGATDARAGALARSPLARRSASHTHARIEGWWLGV